MADYGPVGGNGGGPFDDEALAQGLEIRNVLVWFGAYIDAIQIQYENPMTRELTWSPRHGGTGTSKLAMITLKPDEFITEISGRTGRFVDSLTLNTTLFRYGRYGGLGGENDYEFPDPEPEQPEEVFAFFGKSGAYLDAVGIHTRPRQAPQLATVDANWNGHLNTWNTLGRPEDGDFHMPIRFVGEGGQWKLYVYTFSVDIGATYALQPGQLGSGTVTGAHATLKLPLHGHYEAGGVVYFDQDLTIDLSTDATINPPNVPPQTGVPHSANGEFDMVGQGQGGGVTFWAAFRGTIDAWPAVQGERRPR